jgi:hypothetical protein
VKKECLNCGEPFEGRIDRLYCSVYCKSNYHYEQKKGSPPSIYSKIDKQLKFNRRLLLQFNKAGKSTVRKEKLLSEGFNPKLFTHYWKNKKGQVYLFCYDVGFLELIENGKAKYVLVNYQEQYMGKI